MSKWGVNKHTFLRCLTSVDTGHALQTSRGIGDIATYPG